MYTDTVTVLCSTFLCMHTTHCRATGATLEMAKGDDVFRHFVKSRSAHMSSQVRLQAA
jgi:hypothetical protein